MQRRAIERRAAALGCAAILAAAVLAVGCAESPPQQPDARPRDFAVLGSAAGLLVPVTLELGQGAGAERLTVTQDGTFAFASRLEDGASYTVSLVDDTLAVGAWREQSASRGVDGDQDDDSADRSGAVYVFRRSGTDWQQEAYLKASNTDAEDAFGYGVALAGDTLAVGAPGEDSTAAGVNGEQDDNAAERSGAIHVFRRSGATWRQEVYLKASNTGAGDHFGQSVALSGDTLAVGAYYETSASRGVNGNQADDSALGSGAVYIFH